MKRVQGASIDQKKMIFGYRVRADRAGWLEYGESPALRRPLAGLLTVVIAFFGREES